MKAKNTTKEDFAGARNCTRLRALCNERQGKNEGEWGDEATTEKTRTSRLGAGKKTNQRQDPQHHTHHNKKRRWPHAKRTKTQKPADLIQTNKAKESKPSAPKSTKKRKQRQKETSKS